MVTFKNKNKILQKNILKNLFIKRYYLVNERIIY